MREGVRFEDWVGKRARHAIGVRIVEMLRFMMMKEGS